jgi:MscS family membrane protein
LASGTLPCVNKKSMLVLRWATILCFISLTALGQIPGLAPASAPPPKEEPDDRFGRTTPRGTVLGLIRAVQREDLDRAAKYLDTTLPEAKARELAEQLKVVLDRRLFIDPSRISDEPGGRYDDDEDVALERIGSVEGPQGEVPIILRRKTIEGRPIWLFARATLDRIPAVYHDIGANWVERNLPEWFRSNRILGVPLWRWLSVLLNLAAALMTASVLNRLAQALLRRGLRRLGPEYADDKIFEFNGPVRVLCIALSFLVLAWFSTTLVTRGFWNNTAGIVSIIGFTWLAMRIVDGAVHIYERRITATSSSDLAVRRLVQRLLKVLLILIGFATMLRAFGKDPTTLIAGLGVGGIAIAFAAQKTLENFFGGVMLISDRPIRVGDFCQVGSTLGTVEDIGMRSTRIRTLTRTVVSIPNGVLATERIENFALRDKFLMRPTLGLRYETTPDQLREVIRRITELLKNHPLVETDIARVRFVAFNAFSLDLEVFCYVFAADWASFLAEQEKIMFRIMDIVRECGTGFAFPSRTIYMAKDEFPPSETASSQTS